MHTPPQAHTDSRRYQHINFDTAPRYVLEAAALEHSSARMRLAAQYAADEGRHRSDAWRTKLRDAWLAGFTGQADKNLASTFAKGGNFVAPLRRAHAAGDRLRRVIASKPATYRTQLVNNWLAGR